MRKNMIKLLFAPLILLSALNTAQAATTGKIACPDPTAIQAVGLEVVKNTGGHEWGAYTAKNNYGTDRDWTFTFGFINAPDEAAARKHFESLLTLLKQYMPPARNGKEIDCFYIAPGQVFGFAVSPPLDIPSAMTKLRNNVN